MTRELTVADLQPGDLLLSKARTEIGKLIAWVGDTDYSHAAVVFSRDDLVEATPPKVRLASLADRAAQGDKLEHLDVFRPRTLHDRPLDDTNLAALQMAGNTHVGKSYAASLLPFIAISGAIRNKTTDDERLRFLLKLIIDAVMPSDADALICTELAYRVYDAGGYTKDYSHLKPVLIPVPPQHPAWPGIDLVRLYLEIRELLGDRMRLLADAPPGTATARELQDSYDRAMSRLGLGLGLGQGATRLLGTNPKAVILIDLEHSPTFSRLGRLKLTNAPKI